MSDCIFCKIVQGDIPAHKIYEDDTILAFLDIFPINEGHVLVIPKQHVSDFHKCDTDLYTHMMVVAQKIAQKIQSVYTPSKVALRAEGFEVNHTHIHVMPLYASGDLHKKRPDSEPDHVALARVAEKLKI